MIAALAYWSRSPLVVPSLGPTAFLVFNRSQSIVARPRNTVSPGVPHVVNCAGRVQARCLCITARSAQSHPEFLP
ncbi:MAG: hypothetical protein ACRDN0_09585 [Trebonia sp.]